MARGAVFDGFYSSSSILSKTPTGGGGVAEMILRQNNIPNKNVVGSGLSGYDIKAQDCVSMLRLSLLAGDNGEKGFPEVYAGPDGVAQVVHVGTTRVSPTLKDCFLTTTNSNFINNIDHVLVKAKDPLPTRYHGNPLNVMGNGTALYFQFTCPIGYSTKNASLGNDAWAEFETSPQSKVIQDKIKALVDREKWEQLVGYKYQFADIPRHVSFSLSQTTPRSTPIPFTSSFTGNVTINLGESDDDQGGVVDISGLNGIGAPVLDLVKGSDLLAQFSSLSSESGFNFSENDYYCLLSNECGVVSISRGQNWWLLPAGSDQATILLRKSGSAKDANLAFNYGLPDADLPDASLPPTIYYFRRTNLNINSIADLINANIGPNPEQPQNSPLDPLSPYANYNPFRGSIVTGLGNDKGVELTGLELAYTIAKSSIQLHSPQGDAFPYAQKLAAGGVIYTPIIVKDVPAGTGWNGKAVYPVAPPNDEAQKYDVDSPIDELEGTVIDLSAPWCSAEQAAGLSSNIKALINGDSGNYKQYSYKAGGYNLLPGMEFDGGVIQSLEFNYSDNDVVATNITTGPKYYPIGSYSDSQYVKRSETITRTAKVAAGSNRDGLFIVEVDGLGRYEAINGLIEPIYPGDRVEVRLLNVPVELD